MIYRLTLALVGLAIGGYMLWHGAQGWVMWLAFGFMATGVIAALVGPHGHD